MHKEKRKHLRTRVLEFINVFRSSNPKIKEEMVKDKDAVDRNGIKPILQYVM